MVCVARRFGSTHVSVYAAAMAVEYLHQYIPDDSTEICYV